MHLKNFNSRKDCMAFYHIRVLKKPGSKLTIFNLNWRPVFFNALVINVILTSIVFCEVGSWFGSIDAVNGPEAPISIPLFIQKRELITVTVTGQIKVSGSAPFSGPEGSGYYGFDGSDRPPFGYSHGIVILKINENHFPIEGGARTLESPHTGSLSLYVNDDKPNDNAGSFQVTVDIGPEIVGDADEDGLDDALEDELLDQYAPELKFDEEEEKCSLAEAYWYLRNCDLVDGDDSGLKILDRRQVPFYPEWYLQSKNGSGLSTNILDNPVEVAARCDVRNSHRRQLSWARVLAAENIGVYGHVVPYDNAILLQYWIFFAWNGMDIDFLWWHWGDHEGDWEHFEIYLDPLDPKNPGLMKRAVWHGHGRDYLARWDPNDPEGPWQIKSSRHGAYPSIPQEHLPLYIEEGTHGLWPTDAYYLAMGKNRGNGRCFIPTNVTNLGEVYRPRLGTEVILQFNGLWGENSDSPPGPGVKTHRWRPSPGGNNEAKYVGNWNNGFKIGGRLGRISTPWKNLSFAIRYAQNGQTILIFPGNYPGSFTISKPVILKAPHGNVVIGN